MARRCHPTIRKRPTASRLKPTQPTQPERPPAILCSLCGTLGKKPRSALWLSMYAVVLIFKVTRAHFPEGVLVLRFALMRHGYLTLPGERTWSPAKQSSNR